MKIKRNIYLTGFFGTGKSTVGRELARLMGRKFVDMDHLLESRMGKTINEIYDEFGLEFLEEKELELAKELVTQTNRIVSTGGSTILNDEIREMFSNTGIIICLVTDTNLLVDRLTRTDKRPRLRGEKEEIEDKVKRLLEDKKNIYFGIPIRIDTTDMAPQVAAKKIIDTLKMKARILDQLHDQYIFIS